MREPEIADAFKKKTLLDTGVTFTPKDLTLEKMDLIGLIEEEQRREQAMQQQKMEAENRRLNV